MRLLFIFPTPADAVCTLRHDTAGWTLTAHPATHPSGRPGQAFDIPDATPNEHGAALTITAPKKIPFDGRGILILGSDVYLRMDDFHLADEPPPVPVPIPPTLIPIPPAATPQQIVMAVWATGQYELGTKAGCGTFTEACCTALHDHHSIEWGHIRKTGAQNQYHGHAVDAVMLRSGAEAGIYDLITDSESPNAKPAYNFSGPPVPSLWYYPA